jgi:sulfatase maturation enzyme AslB (radical SAM superfamily)
MGKQLTQLAFGIMNIKTNPDFFKMAEYARDRGVIPNFTMHSYDHLDTTTSKRIANLFGAVAISYYNKEGVLRNAEKLYEADMKQINIHFMLASESYDDAMRLIHEFKEDERFKYINAIVFLSLKQKGRGKNFHQVDSAGYAKLVKEAIDNEVPIGFDSCSAHKFLNSIKDFPNYKQYEMVSEPCESSLFSAYLSAEGKFYPCSFMEGVDGWDNGIDVLNKNTFEEVWNSQNVNAFRCNLIQNGRHCPAYII